MSHFIQRTSWPSWLSILLLAVLAGCGNNGAAETGSPAVQEAVPTANTSAAMEPAVRHYTDSLSREVELPGQPQRIIAHYFAPEITALGASMIGTNYLNAELSLTDEQLKGIEDIGSDGINPDLEKTMSVNPDLMIVPDFLEPDTVAALEKIAPTVVMSYSEDPFTRLRKLGEVTGLQEAAEQWISGYEAKAEQKRLELQPYLKQGETASAFILHEDKKLYVYGTARLGPTMYEALGFKQPAKLKELFADDPSVLWKEISLEVLADYAGDRVFFVTTSGGEESVQEVKDLLNGPVWNSVPAVKNGHAYVVDTRWALNDPLTLDWLLDEMPKLLMK